MFKQPPKITIVIRTPWLEAQGKDGDVLISDDNCDLAIAAINRLRNREPVAEPTSVHLRRSEMAEQDKPEACQSCYFNTPDLTAYDDGYDSPGVVRKLWLCELCANSLAGNVARYSSYGCHTKMIAGLVMNAANHIIAEIRKQTEPSFQKEK
jgi:hypothetical protein